MVFHGRRHSRDMPAAEVGALLRHLAVDRKAWASTQNRALHAAVFLYCHVLCV
jgi:hypothetical protein